MELHEFKPLSELCLSKLYGEIEAVAVSIAQALETRLSQVFDEYPAPHSGQIEFVHDFSSRVELMKEQYFVDKKLKAETAYCSDGEDFLFYRSLEKDFMKPGTLCGEVKGLYDLIPKDVMDKFHHHDTFVPPKKLARYYTRDKQMFTLAKIYIAERVKEKFNLYNKLKFYTTNGNMVLMDDDLRSMRRNVKKSM